MPHARPARQIVRIILLFFVTLIAASAWAQTITSKTIDRGSGGNTGQFTSQAIVDGNPAVAYYNVTDANLMFARNDAVDGSGNWSIVTVDATGDVGQFASLAVVNGTPAITYYDVTNTNLKYVRANDANGTTWGTPVTVDANGYVGTYTSLAVVDGNPAISYYDAGNRDLKYVRASDASGASWGAPLTIDAPGNVGTFTSLAVVNGNPAISYYDIDGNLKYVRANDVTGANWGPPAFVDTDGDVGKYSSLVVVNGKPAISYYNNTNFYLKYVRALDPSGANWGTPVILDTSQVGEFSSLAVINGNPAVSYYSFNQHNVAVKYVRANDPTGANWGMPINVDSIHGGYTSLVLGDGKPAIGYYADDNQGHSFLKYVRANDASGTTWPAGTVADSGSQSGSVGSYTSQAVVNGNPAISYYDALNLDLKYVRANDAGGTSWATPVAVDTGQIATGPGQHSDVGLYSSLAVVNGNPAISYYDKSIFNYDKHTADLKYVRANDLAGASWGTPVTVDATGDVGQFTSLAVVNGNPAISYYDASKGDLKYVRANDATGTSWGTPVTVDSKGECGAYTSLGLINGKPAISYYDVSISQLKYVRASDAIGASWGAPLAIDNAGDVGQFSSLALINGNPAISYYQADGLGDLRYVRANDADGTNWGPPVLVDRIGDVGLYTSLVEVNGNAAISYFDKTNFDLKWATVASPGAKALNISTRDQVKSGENVLIGGFIITGDAPKKVIVRAIGPSIAADNGAPLPGTLQDPVLELHGPDGSLILRNDNWKDTQRQQIEETTLAPKDARESAIVATLDPGTYTMVLSGKDGAEGIAVVEAYDLTPTTPSQLANISSRGLVQTGDNVIIAGFILGGDSTQDSGVAIRGLGPSLKSSGVTDALADPTLDLRDKDGNRIEFNDNYTDNPPEAAELAANGLTPKDPHEAGLFRTLAPGTYTVILAGHGSDTGIGLVEVYNLR